MNATFCPLSAMPGEDSRERDGSDEAEEGRAGDVLGEEQRCRVPALVDVRDRPLADERHRAEAEHERQQVEEPDEERGPVDRRPRCLRVGHGVEALDDEYRRREAERDAQPPRRELFEGDILLLELHFVGNRPAAFRDLCSHAITPVSIETSCFICCDR
jgi:hypothetical protein